MKLAVATVAATLFVCGLPRLGDLRASGELQAPAKLERGSTSVWDGAYTIDQARRGAALTDRCGSCHGFDFEGDIGPTLMGPVFLRKWNGKTLGDLFQRIVDNIDVADAELTAGDRESLRRQRTTDVLAFILIENGFPAGRAELPDSLEILNRIRFQASRP